MGTIDHDEYAALAHGKAIFHLLEANVQSVATVRQKNRPKIVEAGGRKAAPSLLENLPEDCYLGLAPGAPPVCADEAHVSAFDLGFIYDPLGQDDLENGLRALLAHLGPHGRIMAVLPGELARESFTMAAKEMVELGTKVGLVGATPCPLGLPGDAAFLCACAERGIDFDAAGKMLADRALAACDAGPTSSYDLPGKYRVMCGAKPGPRIVAPPPKRLVLPGAN